MFTLTLIEGMKRFVTLIESQPLKRFRYSNVLENNLIAHIYQKTGNTVEKIFWRFPRGHAPRLNRR